MPDDQLDKEVLSVVEQYAYDRHRHLTRSNIVGPGRDELERMKIDSKGYLVYSVENVHISEKAVEDDIPTWYVFASLTFEVDEGEPIEGGEDIYQAYRDDQGEWCIEWYAS